MESKISLKDFNSYFPKFEEVRTVLEKNNITYAIFAGSEVWLIANSRKPTDLDILVSNDDLPKVAELLGQEVKTKSSDVVSANFALIGNIEIVANVNN